MKKNKNIFKNPSVQTLITSLLCILIGVIVGYIVLLLINAEGANKGIIAIMKSWANSRLPQNRIKNLSSILVHTAPLLMCSLSVLFAYKVGLFNIGAAGQYCVGIAASLFCALKLGWGWLPCTLLAMAVGGLLGFISGFLKAYANVSEVISGIMLNWIGLYCTNIILTNVKEPTSPYTYKLYEHGAQAKLPSLGIQKLFNNYEYITIALPLAIIIAFVVWFLLEKTKFGYELKATGLNKNAAKYAGMTENRNIIITLVIAGSFAGLGAAFYYLSGIEQWSCTTTSVPGMGFNGIAAAFLGGLSPIGAILSSYFIQHITAGGRFLDLTIYSSQVADLITGIIIYLCGFVAFFKIILNNLIIKAESKKKEGGKQ